LAHLRLIFAFSGGKNVQERSHFHHLKRTQNTLKIDVRRSIATSGQVLDN
jgi:hypothetical protein